MSLVIYYVPSHPFSEQSLSELNLLNQSDQLQLMEKLSSLTSDILSGDNNSVGTFIRNGKTFYRLRIDQLRVYFEKLIFLCIVILFFTKNSLKDFLVRCKMPSSEEAVLKIIKIFGII